MKRADLFGGGRFQWRALALLVPLALLVFSSCLPKTPSEAGGVQITLYGFSILKESLEKAVYPAFAAKWKQEHGQDVRFTSSFAGSETVTNQILQGVGADIAILSIERDVERLQQGGFVTSDWHARPQRGIVNKTPFVILVRAGNPKGIRDFADLARPGMKLIHPGSRSSNSKSIDANILRNFQAGSSNASPSRARSPTTRKSCSSTNPSARSTRKRASVCGVKSARSCARSKCPPSSSRTIRKRLWNSATASPS
ncbi:MAG TPA: substrate-binding domain-containing protein [Pyrinomonadaceae bacterium]